MNRAFFSLVTPALIAFFFMLPGCSAPDPVDIENSAVAVMETRGTERTSRIVFYNENLEETGHLDLPYATFGGIFYNPLVSEGFLYAIPQGEYDKKDGNMAVRIDLATLSVDEYRIEQPVMNAIATNGETVWTCNTFNRESFINRCAIADGSVSSISVPDEFIMNILWKNDTLYAFSKSMSTNDTSVYYYDDRLNLIERIESADENLSVYRTAAHEDLVYFCGIGADEDAGHEGTTGVLDTQSNTIEYMDLGGQYPSSIAFFHGKLLVSHYDPFQESKTNSPFSVVDLETKNIERFDLGHPVEQIAIRGGSLFMLGGTTVYRYDPNTMQCIESAEIPMMPGDFSYISGMFAMP